MHDTLLMQILYGRDDLTKFSARLLLFHATVRNQVVEDLAARRVLHDQIERLLGLYDLEELDDVRMVQTLHDLDLAEEFLQRALVQLRLVDDLDGDLFTDELVFGQLDFGKITLAYRLDETILADVRIVGVSGARRIRAARVARRRRRRDHTCSTATRCRTRRRLATARSRSRHSSRCRAASRRIVMVMMCVMRMMMMR